MIGDSESAGGGPGGAGPVRVFVSYAHGDAAHEERVRGLWLFLRANGIDARLDLPASEERRDWPQWMTEQVQDADRILVIASPGYKLRAEGDAAPEQGRGVQWEAWLIRERFYADQRAGLRLVLPVVLAGCSAADIPLWLGPAAATHYVVSEFTVAGAEMLLRALTGQPGETEPPIGAVPSLPARGTGTATGAARPALRTEVLIDARMTGDGQVASAVTLGGSPLCQRQAPLPVEVAAVWGALRLPPLAAAERMADAGRRLAGMLFDEDAQRLLAGVADRLPPGDTIEVVLSADCTVAVAAGGTDSAWRPVAARWVRWGCSQASACTADPRPPGAVRMIGHRVGRCRCRGWRAR